MINDDHATTYRDLVAQRKRCRLCAGLRNPSDVQEGRFDGTHVGPWSLWQGNLHARVMVVGQDWGDVGYFTEHHGRDTGRNPTNENLARLLDSIGVRIGQPDDPAGRDVAFFTNAILCLKTGGLQGTVRGEWFRNCRAFLRRQIEIVRPRVVVGLGARAHGAILGAFGHRAQPLREAITDARGVELLPGCHAFAAYHCGARVINTHRCLEQQLADWGRIGAALTGRPR